VNACEFVAYLLCSIFVARLLLGDVWHAWELVACIGATWEFVARLLLWDLFPSFCLVVCGMSIA
jgi:hypothetical protein